MSRNRPSIFNFAVVLYPLDLVLRLQFEVCYNMELEHMGGSCIGAWLC
jgi:hypothetical protein